MPTPLVSCRECGAMNTPERASCVRCGVALVNEPLSGAALCADEVRSPTIVAAVMLFAALLPWPYAYYSMLRLVVCGVSAWLASSAAQSKRLVWAWVFGVIALVFNPVAPLYLKRSAWAWVDVITGTVFLYSLRKPYRRPRV